MSPTSPCNFWCFQNHNYILTSLRISSYRTRFVQVTVARTLVNSGCTWHEPWVILIGPCTHSIYGTGIFTYMTGWFLRDMYGYYTIHGCYGIGIQKFHGLRPTLLRIMKICSGILFPMYNKDPVFLADLWPMCQWWSWFMVLIDLWFL